jgi:hypothetical protein
MAKPARSFDSDTHSLLYAPEQPDHCRRAMRVFEKEKVYSVPWQGREGVVGRAGSQGVLEIETIH